MIERDPRLPAPAASALHVEHGPTVAEVAEVLGLAPEKPADQHGRRPAWVMSLIVIGVLVGGAIIGFIKFVNGPVSASAIAPTPSPAHVISTKPATNQLAGLNFEMTYPGIFDQMSQLKNDAQALEQYNISSKADYRRVMAVAVHSLPSNLIDDDSSYKFRKIHPEDYKVRVDKLGGESVYIMSKTDNTEVTLFWPHKERLLTVSMTSTNSEDVLADFMKAVEPTLRWRT